MGPGRARANGVAALAVALLCAGCGTTSRPPQETAVFSPTTSSPATAPGPDTRACAGAEAVLRHVAADTARWSPTRRPFDKVVAARLSTKATELAAQAPQARGPHVRTAVAATATAFGEVSASMQARDRAGVKQAISRSRAAYQQLKRACGLE